VAPREYSETFKRDAIELVRSGLPIRDVARRLKIPRATLWGWMQKAGERAPEAPAMEVEREEDYVDPSKYQSALARIAQLERENEMLQKAAAYFAKRMKP
jgi:transposase